MNALVVFAKAPVPGEVKTRLRVPLSAEQAARLYECFVQDTVDHARLAGEAAVSVAYAPLPGRPDLAWLDDAPPWFPQSEGDLGERLVDAFARAFRAGASKVVVIGSDCPDLEAGVLSQAFARLEDVEVVLGPAEDGGYYLIGLRSPKPHLFTRMEWSSPEVLRRTIERLRSRRESFWLLPVKRDVDDFADLKSLYRRLASGEAFAPRTHAAIRDLIVEDLFNMPVGETISPWKGGRQ